ncbi:hypothetical protein B0H14DRAFT_179941 [Mycena olivaceomarginata]|nr:hypothetical protein B0H14DRAFT_179941 [Mycena olivaceomarginata]
MTSRDRSSIHLFVIDALGLLHCLPSLVLSDSDVQRRIISPPPHPSPQFGQYLLPIPAVVLLLSRKESPRLASLQKYLCFIDRLAPSVSSFLGIAERLVNHGSASLAQQPLLGVPYCAVTYFFILAVG